MLSSKTCSNKVQLRSRLKKQLGLTQLELTGLSGELFWYSAIFSTSSSLPPWKCLFLQNYLPGTQLDLKYSSDVNRLKSCLTRKQVNPYMTHDPWEHCLWRRHPPDLMWYARPRIQSWNLPNHKNN